MLFPRKAVAIADGANLDSFSRLRVSTPQSLFDAQFTYGLQPLLFEQVIEDSSTQIEHDSTNRLAQIDMVGSASDTSVYMQTFEHFRYQPGKSQLVFITFNMVDAVAGVTKFAGYCDGSDGVEFRLTEDGPQWAILSSTDTADEVVDQQDWNLDALDGLGPSGITLNVANTQIAVIDLQALYVGRVRVGFDIAGVVVYVHEFLHSNLIAAPYMATANLPIRVGMTNGGSSPATAGMQFVCCSVASEGGMDDVTGYSFSVEGTDTAGSGTATHVLSVRPKQTFNSLTNRIRFLLESVDIVVTGNAPVSWQLVIGQELGGSNSFADVNTTYSSVEYNTAGSLTGSPAVVIAQGYVAASATTKQSSSTRVPFRYPISLDAGGNHRLLGQLSVICTGIGNSSACRAVLNWKEVR